MVTRHSLVIPLALLAACSANRGSGTVDDTDLVDPDALAALRPLVQVATLAVGDATCPDGGVELRIGLDDGTPGGTPGDGVLQDEEVDTTQAVCNGAAGDAGGAGVPGLSPLVESVAVEPGATCESGGVTLRVGFDDGDGGGTAGDGALQDGEVESSQTICNGKPGSASGTAPLVEVGQADSQSCPDGGVEIKVGLDDGDPGGTAGNGTLEAEEVDRSEVVCAGESAPLPLVATVVIEAGDTCPAGGSEVRIGLDDGSGQDGIAGDNTLQEGEVRLSQVVCDGIDGDPGTPGADAPLVEVVESADGLCPDGGVTILVGADDGDPSGTAGNGILEPDEIDVSETVCSGVDAPAPLFERDVLEVGDEVCPDGGVRIRAGFDDGGGEGGIEGDGALQPGEVTLSEAICNGAAAPQPTPTPGPELPEGQVGSGSLVARGGDGETWGGNGGRIYVTDGAPTQRGWLRVHPTGSLDLAVVDTIPGALDFGSQPFVVSSDVTAPAADSLADMNLLADGALFYNQFNGGGLARKDAADSYTFATGLQILPGATLTLDARNAAGFVGSSLSSFNLGFDALEIGGRLLVDAGGVPFVSSLDLRAQTVHVLPTGVIDFDGDTASGPGGTVTVRGEGPNPIVRMVGNVTVAGTGSAPGGRLEVYPSFLGVVGGNIDARGGSQGGQGGSIYLGQAGFMRVRGNLMVDGGAGAPGGSVRVEAYDVRSSASITARGGAGEYFGAHGGAISLLSYERALRVSGFLSARGGDAYATSGGEGPNEGGEGGVVELSLGGGQGEIAQLQASFDLASLQGTLGMQAEVDVSGGDAANGGGGANGGEGGRIEISRWVAGEPTSELQVLGTSYLDVSGGEGNAGSGGDGGTIRIERFELPQRIIFPGRLASLAVPDLLGTGGVVVDSTLVGVGGEGFDMGGDGASVFVGGEGGSSTLGSPPTLVRSDMYLGGAVSRFWAGEGGYVRVFSDGPVYAEGQWDLAGADLSVGVGGEGNLTAGEGGAVSFDGASTVLLGEDLFVDISGGFGSVDNSYGGEGGSCEVFGGEIESNATLFGVGGSAVTTGTGTLGNSGAIVSFFGIDVASVVDLQRIDVSSGTGDNVLGPGTVTVDSVLVFPTP
ncbi:MAG: hypothetical protein H6732_05580 [Alphaproteobacteria bacterium]|nr:hypothetical protein [Alphaproteobacteria bacterium]